MLDGDEAIRRAVDAHSDYVAGETLAVELRSGGGGEDAPDGRGDARGAEAAFARSQAEIEGHRLQIALRRVERR